MLKQPSTSDSNVVLATHVGVTCTRSKILVLRQTLVHQGRGIWDLRCA